MPFIFLFLILQASLVQSANKFCSVFCSNQACTTWTSNVCTTCQSPDYFKNTATNLCQLTATSGWVEVDRSADAGGTITPNSTTTTTCGANPWRYRYYGNLAGNSIIRFPDLTGPLVPHYQLRVMAWIILLDGWGNNDVVKITLDGTQTLSMPKSSSLTNQVVCLGGAKQDYLRFDQTYSHNIIGPYTITITTNNTSTFKWGVKQLIVLVKTCHFACTACNGSLVNQCSSCDQQTGTYKLSGTTCNQSCLTGYGDTAAGLICVLCDLKCIQCFQTSTNCSSCKATGSNSSFLYPINSSCLAICPVGTYPNSTDRICYFCDPSCLNCGFNSSYCYQCDTALGFIWFNFSCITTCPNSYYVSNNGTNCSLCSSYCLNCFGISTNCSSCQTSGIFSSYFYQNTCVVNCPTQTYQKTVNSINVCSPCDSKCLQCTGFPIPCSICSSNYYFLSNECLLACPTGYFEDSITWTCLSCDIYCVDFDMKMYFDSELKQKIYVDIDFSEDMDFLTFPYKTFQSFSINSELYTIQMFSISYEILNSKSYRVIVQPKGYIFLYNQSIKCQITNVPAADHKSINFKPFKEINYGRTSQLVWFVIKTPDVSDAQKQIINRFTGYSDQIISLTTAPYVQELKKSGVFSLLFGGAQITSCSVLINTVPAQNMYTGVRIWASFIFFDVPPWQKNSNLTKYFVIQPVQNLIKNSRLLNQRKLFDTNNLQWRFQRTGFTTFFIYDTYPVLAIIILSWILLIVIHCIKCKSQRIYDAYAGKIFDFIHKIHEISILYIVLSAILEWLYFQGSSTERWLSIAFAIITLLYFLTYELYIYYDMMKYPVAQIGNKKYTYFAVRYGGFLKNIRYQQYDLKERWSPKHWFRPYNYHILSFYKKILMISSVPIFFKIPHAQASVLILLQILEIVRFCYIWPFNKLWRNMYRLILQVTLLGFFMAVLIQGFLIKQIMLNKQTVLQSITLFYKIGWIGFALVFLFNIGFLLLTIIDLIRSFFVSNQKCMDQIRQNYFYAKLQQYESENLDVELSTVNKWIRLGNLNEKNVGQLPNIYVRLQYIKIEKIKQGYEIFIKKLLNPQMKQKINTKEPDNIRSVKINKQFLATNQHNKFYYILGNQVLSMGSKVQKQQSVCVILKTFMLIEQSQYKQGELVELDKNKMSQKLEFYLNSGEKQTKNLEQLISGTPLSVQAMQRIK